MGYRLPDKISVHSGDIYQAAAVCRLPLSVRTVNRVRKVWRRLFRIS